MTTIEESNTLNPTTIAPSSRLQEYLAPAYLLALSLTKLPPTLWSVLLHRPRDLLFFSRWTDELFQRVWAMFTESETCNEKIILARGCRGVVIELGPGFGSSLEHFDRAKVKHVYMVEPNVALHDRLRENIRKFGWGPEGGSEDSEDSGRCTIVSCGIEDDEGLRRAGVPHEDVDTILSIQVLCTVPTPERILPALHRLLKPGGQLRIFEHIQSHDETTRRLQGMYDWVWHIFLGGCLLSRPTDRLLVNPEYMGFRAGEGWGEMDLNKIKGESRYCCIPCVWGTLTKA